MPRRFYLVSIVAGLGLCLASASCNVASPSRSLGAAPPLSSPPPVSIYPLLHPRLLLREYAEPTNCVEQVFVWSSRGMEWKLRRPTPDARKAGIELYRPIQLGGGHETLLLTFLLHPPASASQVALSLCGEPQGAWERGHREASLDAYRAGSLGGSEIISIPLADFLAPDLAGEPGPWPDIHRVQIRFLAPEALDGDLVIRNLRIRTAKHPALR